MSEPVLVVTGGSSGLGRAVIDGALKQWPDVLVANLDLAAGPVSERVCNLQVDVTDQEQLQAAQERVEVDLGPVRHLVANVGVQQHVDSQTIAVADWNRLLGINLTSVLLTCQAFGTGMRMRGVGSIVCMSSVAERFGFPRRLPYAVSKAGISALVRTLAVEWATDNVRINAVAPGYVETPLLRNAIRSGFVDEGAVLELSAIPRLGRPEEIASPVLFLLSPGAGFITGETVFVDGGYSIKKFS